MKDLPEINLTCKISKMSEKHMDKCVDLFIDVFSRPPWNDTFDSREQVVRFFRSHMQNNYFVGFVLDDQEDIMAMSLGFKKPWINGMEYYIDQFCVRTQMQGRGAGSYFLRLMEEEIRTSGMNAILLNTEHGVPAEKFYLKNGFAQMDELAIMAKVI